ncbi:MAG: family 10 glycosylhydrolase [Ignavibacteria bacterium]|nr:family 10 glycosylhydrolase [Ignavibacteria bacterium]
MNISVTYPNNIYKLISTKMLVFVLMLLIQSIIHAQIDRETRAVWVATNYRLDWPPPTYDQEKQKQALVKIFDNIKEKNLNTVYFQVRNNGTVLFNSSYEPLSPYITGKVGGIASYDPLKFAIEEAHKHGLEIHAWINTVRCFTGNESATFNNPNHIAQRKPEWVVEDFREGVKSYWLDPGLPEVREYIANIIEEMVDKYDVDGVHLDFIRYPGKNFDDAFSYNVYANGIPLDDWRRNNITSLVELINKKVKSKKPFVKMGAAPIGVFKNQNGMFGWEGFTEIYQDSREWLRRGLLDYVAPQIYWSLNENTRFDLLAKEWVENSFGRQVVLGIGAYKENVKPEIEEMINYSRIINADGVAFFRYSSIADYNFKNFHYKVLPTLMSWLGGIYPNPPSNLEVNVANSENGKYRLQWKVTEKQSKDSIAYFGLYSLPHPAAELLPDYLVDVIPANQNSYSLIIDKPDRVNYYFTLNSISKLWNESIEPSNIVHIKNDDLAMMVKDFQITGKPILTKDGEGNYMLLIPSSISQEIELLGKKENKWALILKRDIATGKNLISLKNDSNRFDSLRIKFLGSGGEVELRF